MPAPEIAPARDRIEWCPTHLWSWHDAEGYCLDCPMPIDMEVRGD